LAFLLLPAKKKLKRVHFLYIEDKAAEKLAPWQGKSFNIAGSTALAKSVITSQAIYLITALEVPIEFLQVLE
jgi:uncharacterized membrane protein